MASEIFTGIATVLSFLACIWLFSAYSHTHPHHRSIPLQMILVLGISDFVQALDSILFFAADQLQERNVHINSCYFTQSVFWFSVVFSLFWACALAVFSAQGINASQEISPRSRRSFYIGILVCFLLSAIFIVPILIKEPNAIVEGCTFHISSHVLIRYLIQFALPLLAILVTVISYIKVGLVLKKIPREVLYHWMINPSFLIWYPMSQLVLYLPYLAAVIYFSFDNTPEWLDTVWRTFIHLSGFVNSIVYLKMRRAIKKSKTKIRSQGNSWTMDGNDIEEFLGAGMKSPSLPSSRKSTNPQIY